MTASRIADAHPSLLPLPPSPGLVVNDLHSRLNATRVAREVAVESAAHVVDVVRLARERGLPVCVSGGRHAMGGQQFATGGVLVDTRRLARVRDLDRARGLLTVEAGIQWPQLMAWLAEAQRDARTPWAIAQKQTGADRLSIGGAVAANIHGRGLRMRPFVADLDALEVVGADGELVRCSRTERPALFRHVVGGYGLFGIVTAATLRLVPRRQLERVVDVVDVESLMRHLDARVADGHSYGDFQFAIDHASDDFLRMGVLSTYRPVAEARPVPLTQRALAADDWARLLHLAHVDKARAFREYVAHYRATDGQRYWSDEHQAGVYLDDYHPALDARLGAAVAGSEMISELYVRREQLADFMADAADALRRLAADVIYGTVRLIERDDETALPWARDRWACVIVNLHVDHTPAGVERAATQFRALIDLAMARGGSYYLTYHRWATQRQLLGCHPGIVGFAAEKGRVDPDSVFLSDWWSSIGALVGDG